MKFNSRVGHHLPFKLLPVAIALILLFVPALLFAVNGSDTTAPTITSVSPPPGSWTKNTTADIVVGFYDEESGIDHASVSVYLNGGPLSDCNMDFSSVSCPNTALQVGNNNASVSVSDNQGNTADYSWSFGVDQDAPVFSNQHPSGSVGSGKPSIGASYSDATSGINPGMTRMYVDDNEVTWSSWFTWDSIDYTPSSPLALGTHTVKVITTDQAYNEGTSIWNFEVTATEEEEEEDDGGGAPGDQYGATEDQYGPNIVPPALCGGATSDTTPTIIFNYSDSSGIDTGSVVFTLDGEQKSASVAEYQTYYTPAEELSEGSHTVELSLRDTKGNQSSHSCSFTIAENAPSDTTPPTIGDDMMPADGANTADASPVIGVSWSDEGGAGIDQYSGYLELDGQNVSGAASKDQYGVSYQASSLASGQHTVSVNVKDNAGNQSTTRTWSFNVDAGGTVVGPEVSYYAPWYDFRSKGMDGNWIIISNLDEQSSATVDVYIGGQLMKDPELDPNDPASNHFVIEVGGQKEPTFPGVMSGPVKVISTTGQELLVSQRVHYQESFNEVMAVRQDELGSEYVFTWYDFRPQNGMQGNWILIGNDNDAAADVYIDIAGERMRDPKTGSEHFNIPAKGIETPLFPGIMGGPVKISCNNCGPGQNLIVSQRVHYHNSFSEVMGVRTSDLDHEYYFSWYDFKNLGMNGDWILVGNAAQSQYGSEQSAVLNEYNGESAVQNQYFEIYIGDQKMTGPETGGQFKVGAGETATPIFPGVVGGPVKVVCTSCDEDENLITSQRVHYMNSFEEVQGSSPRSLGDSAIFSWYDFQSQGMIGDWILAGNDSNAAADVYISIGGAAMVDQYGVASFTVGAKDHVTPIFPGVKGGPVRVTCTSCSPGQKLIISQRVHYLNSFNEIVGRPPRVK